jgi:signal transduction histidine kinase
VNGNVCVVFHSAYGNIEVAAQAVREGAMDFIGKVERNDVIRAKLENAISSMQAKIEAKKTHEALIEERSRSRRSEEMLSLARGMSHKIKNIMVGIGGAKMIIDREHRSAPGTAREREALDRIGQLTAILKEALAIFEKFARSASVVPSPTRIGHVLHLAKEHAQLVWNADRDACSWCFQGLDSIPDITVLADRELLVTGFECLFLNAMDAMSDGGTTTVVCEESADHIDVTVKDEGEGFPPEMIEKGKTAFASTKAERGHFGFGLTFANQLTELFGGQELAIRNEGSGGASVTMRIRKAKEERR